MISLRPYQADAFSAILSGFESGIPSQLLVLPTGCGKTVLFAAVCKATIESGGRVLVLAHRGELIQQAANTLSAFEMSPAIEMAGSHAMPKFTRSARTPGAHMETLWGEEVDPESDPKCVVGSIQTFQGKRLKAWPPGWFKLVVCDEAHHATADTYRRAIEHLNPDWYLGVTATWDRGDKTPIVGPNQVFQRLAYEYTITEAVKSGYLAPPQCVYLPTSVNLDDIRTTAGDLNAGDLEKAITPAVGELVNAAIPYLRERRASIIFTPDVGSADAVASAIANLKDKDGKPCGVSAISVSGKDDDRADIIHDFREGRYRVLVNCQLLTEGFDAPFVDTVVLMRPTKSRALMVQMVGRGTRIYPDKPDCLILGYDFPTLKHKLVHPVEMFHGPGLDPVDIDAGKRIVNSGGESDLLKAIERAEKNRKERARLRVEATEKNAARAAKKFDPLALDDRDSLSKPQFDKDDAAFQKRATEGQVQMLARFGFDAKDVSQWGRGRAGAVLDAMITRAKRGLATKKQVDLLLKFGVPNAADLKMSDASKLIDRIKSAGWRFKPEMQVSA